MRPLSEIEAKRHREKKRRLEIEKTVQFISPMIKMNRKKCCIGKTIKIHEFGCGDGFQIPYLSQIGNVFPSDISSDLSYALNLCTSSITHAPFQEDCFNLVFSNHVMEHISDIKTAFNELKRIGKADCLYAFTVPTNLWLLLSVPKQYLDKFKYLFGLRNKQCISSQKHLKTQKKRKSLIEYLFWAFPGGHGVNRSFINCFQAFRISQWAQMFIHRGFEIVKSEPLLIYAPSEWPVVPTCKPVGNICSSVLFILKKNDKNA